MSTTYSKSGNVFEDRPEEAGRSSSLPSSSQSTVRSQNVSSKKAAGAFKTISEVANDLDVQQHVLRFWETKFSHVKPLKRGGGRRYYRPEDVELLKAIHYLLYTEGYTIKGVQRLLREKGKGSVLDMGESSPASVASVTASEAQARMPQLIVEKSAETQGLADPQRQVLKNMLSDLKEIREMIGQDPEE